MDETREEIDDIEACMLIVDDQGDALEIDDPSGKLSANERIGLLVRALVMEILGDQRPDDDD